MPNTNANIAATEIIATIRTLQDDEAIKLLETLMEAATDGYLAEDWTRWHEVVED